MKKNNELVERYRRESPILGNRSAQWLDEPVFEGNQDNLKSHLLRLKGSDTHPELYYYPENRQWISCKLARLEKQEREIEKTWQRYRQDRIAIGELEPKSRPPHIQSEREKCKAKLQVCKEEIAWLEVKLNEAETAKTNRETKQVPPQFWTSGRLHNGILVEWAGWSIKKNGEGILCIDDVTSPYYSLPLWKFKSQVANPMFWEFSHRQKEEARAAEIDNRKRRNVPFPPVPIYDPATNTISYPAYSPKTLSKIKKD